MATARPLNAVEPFGDRLETLFGELELAIKYDRPSILLAVYRSEFVRAEAEAALAEKLRGLGQTVVTYRVTGRGGCRCAHAPGRREKTGPRRSISFPACNGAAGGTARWPIAASTSAANISWIIASGRFSG